MLDFVIIIAEFRNSLVLAVFRRLSRRVARPAVLRLGRSAN